MASPPLMNHKIMIQEDTGTGVNASNEHTPSWTTFLKDVWAEVKILSGRERITAKQVVAEQDARISMRKIRGLHTGMRAKWYDAFEQRTRYFNFDSITPAEGWWGWVINAVEIPPPAEETDNPP